MNARSIVLITAFCLLHSAYCFLPAVSATGPQQLEEILAALAEHAEEFEATLPDFVCVETLTQEAFSQNGKKLRSQVTVSTLTGRQIRKQERGSVLLTFEETREVKTVDGKKANADYKVTGSRVIGAFSSIFLSHFSRRDQRDYLWTLTPKIEIIRERTCHVIDFKSDSGRKRQFYAFDGQEYLSRHQGTAWVDAETLQLARIDFRELNLPLSVSYMRYRVDYAPVKLGDATFWLPVSAFTELQSTDTGMISRVTHNYSNYQRFTGQIKISS